MKTVPWKESSATPIADIQSIRQVAIAKQLEVNKFISRLSIYDDTVIPPVLAYRGTPIPPDPATGLISKHPPVYFHDAVYAVRDRYKRKAEPVEKYAARFEMDRSMVPPRTWKDGKEISDQHFTYDVSSRRYSFDRVLPLIRNRVKPSRYTTATGTSTPAPHAPS